MYGLITSQFHAAGKYYVRQIANIYNYFVSNILYISFNYINTVGNLNTLLQVKEKLVSASVVGPMRRLKSLINSIPVIQPSKFRVEKNL